MTLIDRYIGAAALKGFALVAVGLTVLFSLLEFVEQLSSVGQGRYRLVDALFYVALTVPARLLQVAPVAMLLGCLLTLGTLAKNSELTALKALGVSEWRIVGSVLKSAPLVIAALFLMMEFVIPPAQQFAQNWRTAALSATAPLRDSNNNGFWAQRDGQYLNVQQFHYGNVSRDISVYAFSSDGALQTYIHADRAEIRNNGIWRLTGVTRKTAISASQLRTEHLSALDWKSFLPKQQTQLLILPPESMPPVALYRYVRVLKGRGQQALRYEQELWSKISIPLSLVAMILVTMPFVFGSPRAQSAGQQIAIGATIGMVFTLCQQIAGRLDLLLNLNPAVTALTPPLLLMLLAAHLFRRAHR